MQCRFQVHWFQFGDTGKAHQNTSQFPDPLLRLIVAEMAYNKHPNVVSKGDLNSLFSASACRHERLKIFNSAQNKIEDRIGRIHCENRHLIQLIKEY